MAGGEHEAIAIKPVRILRIILHDFIIEYVTHRSTTHGQTRVTGVSFLDSIDSQESDRVDGLVNQFSVSFLKRLDGSRSNDLV